MVVFCPPQISAAGLHRCWSESQTQYPDSAQSWLKELAKYLQSHFTSSVPEKDCSLSNHEQSETYYWCGISTQEFIPWCLHVGPAFIWDTYL